MARYLPVPMLVVRQALLTKRPWLRLGLPCNEQIGPWWYRSPQLNLLMSALLRDLIRPAAALSDADVCLVGLPFDFGTVLEGGGPAWRVRPMPSAANCAAAIKRIT